MFETAFPNRTDRCRGNDAGSTMEKNPPPALQTSSRWHFQASRCY
jgi:hypothetical protein